MKKVIFPLMKLLTSQFLDETNTMQYSEVYIAEMPFKYMRNSFVKRKKSKENDKKISNGNVFIAFS